MNILVVAPHPDDEVLGMGGTIAKFVSEGNNVSVAIVTKGWEPLYPKEQVTKVRAEAKKANEIMGVKNLIFMDFPVTKLKQVPMHELNESFAQLVKNEKPELVFLPFHGDRHLDHRCVYESCMVALRPGQQNNQLKRILCYETVSETHWATAYIEPNFEPQVWNDISQHLSVKLAAMEKYQSQLRPKPDARSIDALTSLAKWRGSVVGMAAAECFILVREYWS